MYEPFDIIAFREAFAVHDFALFQYPVGVQESIGGDEIYFGVIGPGGEQPLQYAGGGAFSYGYAAGDAYDIGYFVVGGTQEGVCAGM